MSEWRWDKPTKHELAWWDGYDRECREREWEARPDYEEIMEMEDGGLADAGA